MSDAPKETTHTRDGDFYKVTDKVQYFEHQEWHDCKDPYDLHGWLYELKPIDDTQARC